MSPWLTLLTAMLGGSVTSVVVALIGRPKTRAETNAIVTESEVKVSGQAQEWAKIFAAQAEAAERRAAAAEERADAAEARAEEAERSAAHAEKRCDGLERRCDELERRGARLARIAVAQNNAIVALGGTPHDLP